MDQLNFIELEIPFDLEDLLTINYNTEKIKLIIQWLLQTLKRQNNQINKLQEDLQKSNNTQAELLKKVEAKVEKNRLGIENNQNEILQNIDQLSNHQQKIDQNTQEIINLKNNDINKLKQELQECKDKIEELQSDLENKQVQIDFQNQKITDMQSIIKTMQDQIESNTEEIEALHRKIKSLKDNEIVSLEIRIEKLEQSLSVLQIQILVIDQKLDKSEFESFQNRINAILKQLQSLQGASIDQEILDQLSSIIDLTKRLKQLEKTSSDHTAEIAEIQENLKQLRIALSQKADLSDIEQLQDLINQLGQKGEPIQVPIIQQGMSLQEKALLKELSVRLQHIENTYMTKTQIEQTFAKLSDLDKFALKSELDKYAKRIDLNKFALKSDLEKCATRQELEQYAKAEDLKNYALREELLRYARNSDLDDLRKDIESQLANLPQPSGNGKGNIDNNLLQKIKNAITQLDALLKKFIKLEQKVETLEKHASELESQYVFVLQELEQIKDKIKALNMRPRGDIDIKVLQELEQKLIDKINQLAKDCDKKYADKIETKKALKHLEKLIKSLWDFVFAQRESEKDAMLSKKPLMGFSCASCEKNLEQIQGIPEKYHPWNLLPRREPPLSKIGPGFSKLIQSISPDANQTSMFLKKGKLIISIDTKELFEVSSSGINYVGKTHSQTPRPFTSADST